MRRNGWLLPRRPRAMSGASYAALAAGSGRLAAADWALAQFSKLDAPARVEIMGEWLAGTKAREK